YAGNFEIGLSDYPKGGNLAMFSVMIVNGYRFNPYFSMGLGAGAEISTKNAFNFPVFLDMRAQLTQTRVSPFFNLGAGYNLMLMKSSGYYYSSPATAIGFMFNPAFGVRFAINNKVCASMSLGHKYIGSVIDKYY